MAGCGFSEQAEIDALLDARDAAVSSRDLAAYTLLIDPEYNEGERNRADVLDEMQALIASFDTLAMQSSGRSIEMGDDGAAECIQTYKLVVGKGEMRRELVQREQLSLRKTADGWKIIGGL